MNDTPKSEHTELPWRGELARKAIHLGVVVIPIGMLWAGRSASLVALGLTAGCAITADVARANNTTFAAFISRYFGFMMRADEVGGNGRPVRLNGSTVLLVGAFVSVVLFGVANASYGLVIFLVGDAAAGLIGRRFGRRRWPIGEATIWGTAAFIVAGGLVSFLLPGPDFLERLLVVFGCAVTEAMSPLDDNLVGPVAAAALLYFL